MNTKPKILLHIKEDIASGLVVFLVAVPLCLGIALASGAPLFSGIIAGVVGGIVVGLLSKSHVSVSGPAAGLTAIVLTAIATLGSFNLFLCAVVIAGVLQLLLGFIKAGNISNYFPTNVIEGMLSAIGIIIIIKQLPHAVGYDANKQSSFAFIESSGNSSFASMLQALNHLHAGAVIITLLSIGIIVMWNRISFFKKIRLIPGALAAVVVSVVINELLMMSGSGFALGTQHLVNLPVPNSIDEFAGQLIFPDFSGIWMQEVWITAITLAVVASIETLLCIEATDKLDPLNRYTNTNHELKAQGIGNMISGLIGGLPMTSVIVRSTANINAGAKTKLSTIVHGILLLVCVLAIPVVLNKIPLATLAAILLLTGYKLCKPAVFKHMWKNGKYQFVPFIVTILAVVFTDLLKGVALGLVVSIAFILKGNLKHAYYFTRKGYVDGDLIHLRLAEEVSFLNKAAIKLTLEHLPANSRVLIDASSSVYIDHDVLMLIRDFVAVKAPARNIQVTLAGFKAAYNIENNLPANVYVEHQYAADAKPSQGRHQELFN